MTERSFDEMIAYVNRRVADMDISQDFKIELLGMVAAIGCKHEQTAQHWIPCSERLPEKDGKYLVTHRKFGKLEATWNIFYGGDHDSWLWNDEIIAWMPLPDPWRGEEHGV